MTRCPPSSLAPPARSIFSPMTAVLDGRHDFLEGFSGVGQGDDHFDALPVGRTRMEKFDRLTDDPTRVGFDEGETDHARGENRAIDALGITVDMAVFARHASGFI